MDPYKILRVRRNASKKLITRAFRKRALETHPDRGGDPAEFQQVQEAYAVLSDDARRADFDATGEVDPQSLKPDNRLAAVLSLLSIYFTAVIQELVNRGGDINSFDIVSSMRVSISNDRDKQQAEITKFDEVAGRLRATRERFEPAEKDGKAESVELLKDIVSQNLTMIAEARAKPAKEVELKNEALELLKGVSFRADGVKNASWPWTNAETTAAYKFVRRSA